MIRGPVCVEGRNVSHAWALAVLELVSRGTQAIAPLVVTVTGFPDGVVMEDAGVRCAIDRALLAEEMRPVRTVANTIFPKSMWNPATERHRLYERYSRALPRILRSDTANRYGVYFQRMIAYRPEGAEDPVNQLEHVITTWAGGNHRRSALQVIVFDPTRDHSDQRQRGFPCLHQVSFTPVMDTLVVTGFYGTQYLFERGYGNYLGLCELGQFAAQEMGLRLVRMTCVAGFAELGIPKGNCDDLVAELQAAVQVRHYPAPAVNTEE